MNPEILLDAIGMLNDDYLLFEKNHSTISLRRKMIVLIAAILMIVFSIGTALTVSPKFEEIVFNFFSIEEPQIIPDNTIDTDFTTENIFVESVIIGDVIQGKYVHTPVSTHARSGVYLVCTDDVEMRQGSHYDAYYEQNGQFIRLDEHTFKQDYELYGNQIHVEFDWVEYNGNISLTWVDSRVQFRKENMSGDASAALFTFDLSWQNDNGDYVSTSYPVLINLNTGVLTDILAGTNINRIQNIDKSAISPDHSKLLLRQRNSTDYSLYYVDITRKNIYNIDELSGEHTTACSLIDNTLACWNLADNKYTAWTINLTTLERTELFKSKYNATNTTEPYAGIVFMEGFDGVNRWGDMYIGSRFALEVDDSQNIYAIDLVTGKRIKIKGYTWSQYIHCTPSPDGKKLLLIAKSGGLNYDYVGILDFENITFAEFSRQNSQEEYLAYWFDKNTVLISTEFDSLSNQRNYYQYSLILE